MGMNVEYAPLHRVAGRVAIGGAGLPLQAAPSLDFLGNGIQDHRLPYNSRGSSSAMPAVVGWYGTGDVCVAHYSPSAIATANISALANVTNGTAVTLVSSSGAGITVLTTAAPAFFPTSGLAPVTAGVVIDGLPTLQTFGGSGPGVPMTGFYDRTTCVGRAISITGSTSATGGAFAVVGYDAYGYLMHETITAGAGAVTTNGKKAWKCIVSVTPQFTDAHNYSVGTADIYGFGLRTDFFGDVSINWNSAWITANTGYTAADATTPSATTGDVRGTYAVQSASDGTKRLCLYVAPSPTALAASATIGLFGKPQF